MGFDVYRFIKGSVSDEYCCSICHDVLQEPQMLESCEHIFCGSCIYEWIQREGKCPIDRNPIDVQHLRPPMRSFMNLLSQLELCCDFASFGCPKYVRLSELKEHQNNCQFNTGDSADFECFCGKTIIKSQMESHTAKCVPYLKREIGRLKISLIQIKNKNSEHQKIIKRNNIFDIWQKEGSAKKIEIKKTDMTKEMKDYAFLMIADGLNKRNENFLNEIAKNMCEKYGGDWAALITNGSGSFKYLAGTYLQVKIGSNSIKLFKNKSSIIREEIKDARNVKKPIIEQNTMTMLMADDAMTFAERAIFVGESELQIAGLIRSRFVEKYKTNWNCLVFLNDPPHTFGLKYTPKQNTFIKMLFAKLNVLIWQCP